MTWIISAKSIEQTKMKKKIILILLNVYDIMIYLYNFKIDMSVFFVLKALCYMCMT